MKIYCVGGAVRDELLGRPVADRDWVVVGATPEEMLAKGFLPVGRDFPVFLHPETREEYALARTERKQGHGYHGFVFYASPTVTLEEDLARRDLTINAIAKDEEGRLIDPYGGQRDLENKILRHVSPAFAEDPLRILRLARFAARLPDFSVAAETLALAKALAASGELDHLTPERVWQELSRGLMEAKPSRMFEVLRACDALARLLPELDRLWGVPQRADFHPEIDTGVHTMMVIDMAARLGLPLAARFAALTHDLGKGLTPAEILPRHVGHEARSAELIQPLCARLRVPAECRAIALAVALYHGEIHKVAELRPATKLALLERCDALRRPQRFEQILGACEADWRGRLGHEDQPYPAAAQWRALAAAVRHVDARAIVAACEDPQQIPERIRQARLAAISAIRP
ncbi:MAG: multifunctional CCA addition/repair protein [Rhodocyclaceae bacterium]|nr:multifunctional CCA addition/repair protein [Rhodocyclaceae bacterium]